MKIKTGNLDRIYRKFPKKRGWVVGDFVFSTSLLHSDKCNFAWARYRKGYKRHSGDLLHPSVRTLTVLISGKLKLRFPGKKDIILSKSGDFVAFDGAPHDAEALRDSCVIGIRWNSTKLFN